MSAAAELLRRKAADYRALGEEHAQADGSGKLAYEILELVLRELAEAVDELEAEIREAA